MAFKGTIREKQLADGSTAYYARFSVKGEPKEERLDGATNRAQAETELANLMADVRRGTWTPRAARVKKLKKEERSSDHNPRFVDLSSDWHARKAPQVSESTAEGYRCVVVLLNEYWGEKTRVADIDEEAAEAFVAEFAARVRRGEMALSYARSCVSRCRKLLALARRHHARFNPELAVIGDPLDKDRDETKIGSAPQNDDELEQYYDYDQVASLLDAAGQLDTDPFLRDEQLPEFNRDGTRKRRRANTLNLGRRAMIATAFYAGLRVHEVCLLQWRDIDLKNGVIRVRKSKTEKGRRTVNIVAGLRDELDEWKARARDTSPNAVVFPTSTGTPRDKDNAREKVLLPAWRHANKMRSDAGQLELPRPGWHTGRRTFATWASVIGEAPRYVQGQLGHKSARLTQEVYAQAESEALPIEGDERIEAVMDRPRRRRLADVAPLDVERQQA